MLSQLARACDSRPLERKPVKTHRASRVLDRVYTSEEPTFNPFDDPPWPALDGRTQEDIETAEWLRTEAIGELNAYIAAIRASPSDPVVAGEALAWIAFFKCRLALRTDADWWIDYQGPAFGFYFQDLVDEMNAVLLAD
jgi:hypothetical protein